MLRRVLVVWVVSPFLFVPAPTMSATSNQPDTVRLTAAEIVKKNVEARGGLDAWRAIKTMSLTGTMQAGGKQNPELPFVLQLKRPRKSRLELQFQGKTAVQVYDGVHGWKVRPFLGRDDVEGFTPDEMMSASAQADLDGLLIDFAAKGSSVDSEGIETVEGRGAYKLRVRQKDGRTRRVWVDAQTFLEAKIEGDPRRLDGKYRSVEVYFRDYRPVQGLMIAHLLETSVLEVKGAKPERITIESVVLNPALDDSRFAKPQQAEPVPLPAQHQPHRPPGEP